MGLIDSPFCRGCGAEEEISAYVLCECQTFATLKHSCLGSFFLDPEVAESVESRSILEFY